MQVGEAKAPDLMTNICEGRGFRFAGIACEFYTHVTKVCLLLEQQRLSDFWDQGRCAFIILQIVEESCLKTLRELYDWMTPGDSVDYDLQEVVQRLKQQHLEAGFTLAVWHRYVYVTVYREMRKRLPFLPAKKHCGTCKHLSKSNAHVCLARGEIRTNLTFCCETYTSKPTSAGQPQLQVASCANCQQFARKAYFCYQLSARRNKTDAPCPQYSPEMPGELMSLDEACAGAEMAQSAHAADRLMYELSQANGHGAPDKQILAADEIEFMQHVLLERIESVAPHTKKHAIYARQYHVFCGLLQTFCEEDFSEEDALQALAGEFRLPVWTVKRDLNDVRDFLKNVLADANSPSSS